MSSEQWKMACDIAKTGNREKNMEIAMNEFLKGLILGVVACAVLFGVVSAFYFSNRHEKEIVKYVQIQQEIEELREDYVNRDPYEFIDSVPGVRGAADGAIGDFNRKRDEALHRFRSGLPD